MNWLKRIAYQMSPAASPIDEAIKIVNQIALNVPVNKEIKNIDTAVMEIQQIIQTQEDMNAVCQCINESAGLPDPTASGRMFTLSGDLNCQNWNPDNPPVDQQQSNADPLVPNYMGGQQQEQPMEMPSAEFGN